VRVTATVSGPAIGYAVGVQWHPEYDWQSDVISHAIFNHFGDAVRAYVEDARVGGVSLAAD